LIPAPAVASQVAEAIADAHRREWGFVLAATVRVTRDIDIAEECVQDAYAQALSTWPTAGVPRAPGSWLTTVARRRAIDVLRREQTLRRKLPLLVGDDNEPQREEGSDFPDDRLRLIFTCCHPSLSSESQVALTLRLLCGLSTRDVARSFLVSEPTMAARITRAKKKIAIARIPYRVPATADLPARTHAVLTVLHLLFTTGHSAPDGNDLRRPDLVARALDLARMMRGLLPSDPDVAGLLALFLLTDARRATRVSESGRLLLLAEQDRSRWDRGEIAEGVGLLRESLRHRPPGRFALQAAIVAVHATSPTWEATDWPEIVGLYDVLAASWPSPVVALNRAIALGMRDGPQAGLDALDPLGDEPQLATYPYLASARADFLSRLGRIAEALSAYQEALLLTTNEVERRFLAGRIDELAATGPTDGPSVGL
jgi:RNA polymerase sigma factor (sigma-70 family)